MRHTSVSTAFALPAMLAAALAVALVPAGDARAQGDADADIESRPELPELPPAPRSQSPTTYTARTGLEFQISGNEYESFEAGIRVDGRHELTDDITLNLRFDYQYIEYDFEAHTGFVPDAWNDIHTISLGGMVSVALGSDWTGFGGLYLRSAHEGSPDPDDSIIGGGFAGAHIDMGDMLVGLGWGLEDRLQDNARLFPVIVFDWEVTNDFRVSTIDHFTASGPGGRLGRNAFEVIYSGLDRDLDVAAGVGTRFRRFRLDGDGPNPEGVGEDNALDFWLRAAWHPTSALTLSAHMGLVFDGELKTESSDGRERFESYDTALIGGLSLSYRF